MTIANIAPDTSSEMELPKSSTKTIMLLPLEDLRTADYQRPLRARRVRRIIADFDPNQENMPIVSERDGGYWLVDGQHTVAALIDKGYRAAQCIVITGLTYKEEALLFARRNSFATRATLTAMDTFKALLEAADEDAWFVYDLVHSHEGLIFRFEAARGESSEPNVINAVGALMETLERYGRQVLERTLRVLVEGFPVQHNRFHNKIIHGMAYFLVKHGSRINERRLIKKMQKEADPHALLSQAAALRYSKRLRDREDVCQVLEALYDANRKASTPKLSGLDPVEE